MHEEEALQYYHLFSEMSFSGSSLEFVFTSDWQVWEELPKQGRIMLLPRKIHDITLS